MNIMYNLTARKLGQTEAVSSTIIMHVNMKSTAHTTCIRNIRVVYRLNFGMHGIDVECIKSSL